MRREAKRNLQVKIEMALADAVRLLLGSKMRKESVIRPGRGTLPVVNGAAVCSVLVVLASCLLLTAQNVVLTGALGGRVTDQSGAVVLGASVVVQNLQTGVKQSTETNHAGLYRFPVLTPGSYSIAASLKGFRDVQALVQVRVGNTTSQDIKLQVGASVDAVKVIGTTPLLRPTESSASTVLEHSFIEELPLNGRKYTNFTTLAPNTTTATPVW